MLVLDSRDRLVGIFTGRDAVRLLAEERHDGPHGAHRLGDAMTRDPVSVTPRCCAIEALRAMSEGGFRHVPVLDGDTICGVVSRGDFKGMEFEAFRWPERGAERGTAADRSVADIIAGRLALALDQGATVGEACRRMHEAGAGSVVVVDERRRPVGIFTGRDAARALARRDDAAAARLADVMTRDPVCVTPATLAIDALRAMSEGGFRHLPVVSNNELVGVVSRNDFTGVEIDRLDEEEHLKECIW